MVRVFVGRVELITPATEHAVESALGNRDRQTLAKFGRFLQPILNEVKRENPSRDAEIDRELLETYNVQLVEIPTK
jgi:hypothetical protein